MVLSKMVNASKVRGVGLALLCYSLMKRYGLKSARGLFAVAFAFCLYRTSAARPSKYGVPVGAPKWYPIIGHLHTMPALMDDVATFWLHTLQKCDFKTVELCIPENGSIVVLMEEEDRKYLMKDNFPNYQKNFDSSIVVMAMFDQVFGDGIFSTDGDDWLVHRKIASHLFTGRTIGVTMAKVFAEHAEMLKDSLEKKANTGVSFDIQLLLQSLIFDAFCKIAFDASSQSFMLAERGEKPEFQVAFDSAQIISSQRVAKPPTIRDLQRYFRIGAEAPMVETVKTMDDYIYSIVHERKLSFETNPADQPNDILGLYMEHAVKQNRHDLLEDKYIRDVIVNFMVAGRDTTSYVLTNALSMVAEHPEIEKQLVEQMKERMKEGAEHFALKEVKDFPLADAIFNESLCMFPSVPFDLKFAMKEDVLPSGMEIKKGAMVGVCNYALGRDPHYFDNSDEFRPQRWLKEVDGKLVCSRIDEYKFPFFWGGHRICLGKDMARHEAKIFLGVIFSKLKLKLAKPKRMAFVPGPVMFYKDGVYLKAEKR